jgi:hypothetical protein
MIGSGVRPFATGAQGIAFRRERELDLCRAAECWAVRRQVFGALPGFERESALDVFLAISSTAVVGALVYILSFLLYEDRL